MRIVEKLKKELKCHIPCDQIYKETKLASMAFFVQTRRLLYNKPQRDAY